MTDAARHPARTVAFDQLICSLEEARAAGLVFRRYHPATGLSLFRYSDKCVYDRAWTEAALIARGLILHEERKLVVATPFPKFFNAGERGLPIPYLPFEAFEKLDGSLIIIFHHDGRWVASTKGAFDSSQAQWAQARLDALDLDALTRGTTYLAEAVYPENRIVVLYDKPALVMLAAYAEDGSELSFPELDVVARKLGWRSAGRQAFTSIGDLIVHADALPKSQEGFVVRFSDGSRLKLKGAEYKRIHALISRCTPLAIWEIINAGDDLEVVRRDLPEEFWADFDAIRGRFATLIAGLETRLEETVAAVAHLTDKELGLQQAKLPKEIASFVFPYRKKGGLPGVRSGLLRTIRPTANELEGYTPSHPIKRVAEDAL